MFFTNFFNAKPTMVKGTANYDVSYYKRLLYRKISDAYVFKLPPNWKQNWTRLLLFERGGFAVCRDKVEGWIPCPFAPLKYGAQWQITEISREYVNPDASVDDRPYIVGINAELVMLFDDYFGYDDVVTHYATLLASLDKGVQVSLMNSSLGLCAVVDDPKKVKDIKATYAKLTEGSPLVVQAAKKSTSSFKDVDLAIAHPKDAYLVNDMEVARQLILNAFLTEIGVNNANTEKRERLIGDEVNANNEAIRNARESIVERVNAQLEVVSRMVGFECRISAREGGDEYVRGNA